LKDHAIPYDSRLAEWMGKDAVGNGFEPETNLSPLEQSTGWMSGKTLHCERTSHFFKTGSAFRRPGKAIPELSTFCYYSLE
jgi:hypothetical protein